ncbi:MAG: hypothetical protein JNN06_17145 [Gemmobacter sp.]|uniref:hypothetical protein n=1 Tax=Gemmobacter sp. TaxID=1898957 RepID=UPI001A603A07|nr:hypothetical protein [Gemmobacter sp.]MBL8563996.1 hypothetical protein [Gemmobacter sp.]
MRRLILPCVLALSLTTPSLAQETEEPGLMERGLSMFFEGLIGEVAPELDKMQQALQDMQPQMEKLVALMGDVQHYEAPERLPNGDILIRRKAGAPPPPALPEGTSDAPPAGSTDL